MRRSVFKAVLDTNVLFPPTLRDVLLRSAEKGLYQPFWSSAILAELERVLGSKAKLSPEKAAEVCQSIASAFPESLVEDYEHLEALMQNNKGDRHVAAAATLIAASVIVTSNTADFKGVHASIEVQTADVFLKGLFGLSPEDMEGVLQEIAADSVKPPTDVPALLERLKKTVPGFAADMSRYLSKRH